MQELFRKFAVHVSNVVGSFWTFSIVISIILLTGYYFNFSNAWKENISFAGTTITLLVLFFLQKSQNHNDKATHLKLDELIRAVEGARNEVVSVENQTEQHIAELKEAVNDENI